MKYSLKLEEKCIVYNGSMMFNDMIFLISNAKWQEYAIRCKLTMKYSCLKSKEFGSVVFEVRFII